MYIFQYTCTHIYIYIRYIYVVSMCASRVNRHRVFLRSCCLEFLRRVNYFQKKHIRIYRSD